MTSTPLIPLFDPSRQFEEVEDEVLEAVGRVLRSGRYILGQEVAFFEEELASWLGVRYAVGVASGTDALVIALRACGVGAGDEVITTPFSFAATATAVLLAGAVPVFADISLEDLNLDPDSIEGCLSERTRALLTVHIFGHPAPMPLLREFADVHDLVVVEDVAQAMGAEVDGRRAGAWGRAAAFSFYPTKNLGGFGDGGAVATDDPEVAEIARLLRNHGSCAPHFHRLLGYNSRLDEIQAAALRVKLKRLSGWNEERRRLAGLYREGLAPTSLRLPSEREGCLHCYGLFTVLLEGRDSLAAFLGERGIGTGIYYPRPLYANPVFKGRCRAGRCPRAEEACAKALSLPLYPGLREEEVDRICSAVREWEGLRRRAADLPTAKP